MKILIVGYKGMLGSEMMQVLGDYNPTGWDKEDLNIIEGQAVYDKITELKPDIVINAAAYTAVDASEMNKDLAIDINANGPRNLAKVCKDIGCIFIHLSTDYIFNGENRNGYAEDEKNIMPLNVYGQSKAMGEKYIMEINPKYYLIRTSWLFGKNGNSFVHAMIKLAKENSELTVVDDQIGRPTYTLDLAKRIRYIIENKMPYGIYHITNKTERLGISWYDFAKKIFEIKNISISVKPVSSDKFPRPAKRPKISALVNTKLPEERDWQEALKEFLAVLNF